ncbi:MAG: Smr/MutS family protein [Leptospirales bacterium]|nr:Smr/MutS family protein [Leptospirales bacterium]
MKRSARREIRLRKMSVEQARLLLESELNQAFLAGEEQVSVIHGVGEGHIKALVEQVVGECGFARLHQRDAQFYNPGVSLVDLFPPERGALRQYLRSR